MQAFLKAQAKYEYYILYLNSPVVVNKYEKIFVFELAGIIQFYSGDVHFPTCSLCLCEDEIQTISVEPQTQQIDMIHIERKNGDRLDLYGYKTA